MRVSPSRWAFRAESLLASQPLCTEGRLVLANRLKRVVREQGNAIFPPLYTIRLLCFRGRQSRISKGKNDHEWVNMHNREDMYISIQVEKGFYKMTTSDYCKIHTDTALFTLRTEVLEKIQVSAPLCLQVLTDFPSELISLQ